MPVSEKQRYAGVEDEFRITARDARFLSVDKLVSRTQRFFFDESGHIPIFEQVTNSDSEGGRLWTWYGGTFYHDYDSRGPLVEVTTPLTPLDRGIEALVENVLTQRAQLLELSREEEILGVSTHLNLMLDSLFKGEDLCEFKALVPSNAFGHIEAQKLGADVALIATHTISPVLAYLLFNHKPAKGALYRPRKNRRIELCLPYIPEPDQMRAGFLLWFAAVDYITNLIKADLKRHRDWADRYQSPDYYKFILAKFPFTVSDIRFERPPYYIGYKISSGVEENVMENGSKALISTDKGEINIVELAKAYTDFLSDKLSGMATKRQLALLEDFLSGRRQLNVDLKETPKSFRLDHQYLAKATGKNASSYLNGHEVDELASVHLKFLRNPLQVIKPHSRISPGRIIRNLAREIDWDSIKLELVEENEDIVRRYLLEIPLHHTDDYLRLEENFNRRDTFFDGIKQWIKATSEVPNPRSIFAYGTLMNPERDRRNFGVTVTSAKSAYAYGESYDFGDYPVLIENYRTSVVPGVLLSLADFEEAANSFDFYEGCHEPNPLFIRALREIMLDNFESTFSWIYIGNRNNRLVREKLKTTPRLSGIWTKKSLRSRQMSRSTGKI